MAEYRKFIIPQSGSITGFGGYTAPSQKKEARAEAEKLTEKIYTELSYLSLHSGNLPECAGSAKFSGGEVTVRSRAGEILLSAAPSPGPLGGICICEAVPGTVNLPGYAEFQKKYAAECGEKYVRKAEDIISRFAAEQSQYAAPGTRFPYAALIPEHTVLRAEQFRHAGICIGEAEATSYFLRQSAAAAAQAVLRYSGRYPQAVYAGRNGRKNYIVLVTGGETLTVSQYRMLTAEIRSAAADAIYPGDPEGSGYTDPVHPCTAVSLAGFFAESGTSVI